MRAVALPAEDPNGVDADEKAKAVFDLTPLDHIQPRGYIRAILCFPLTNRSASSLIDSSIVQILSHALALTLVRWPFFAGSLVLMGNGGNTTGRLEVQRSTGEARLVVKELQPNEFPHTYEGLEAGGMPLEPLDEALLCSVPPIPNTSKPAPAVIVQANFISGGLLLSISVHHGLTDGKGAFLFSSALAEACRTGLYPDAAPGNGYLEHRSDYFRGIVGRAPDSHPVYKNINITANGKNGVNGANGMTATPSNEVTSRLFTFKSRSLVELKKTAASNLTSCEEWVSTNDCLAALMWASIVQARRPNLSPTTTTSSIALAIDVRSRMDPQLPSRYSGAAVVHLAASEELSTLTSPTSTSPSNLAHLARSIRKSLLAVDANYVSDSVLFSQSFADIRDLGFSISHVHGADLILTSWADFPYYDLDFGVIGQPQWVRKPWSRHPGVIVVLPRTDRRAVVEVILMLREDEMLSLIGNQEFMKWVDKVVA